MGTVHLRPKGRERAQKPQVKDDVLIKNCVLARSLWLLIGIIEKDRPETYLVSRKFFCQKPKPNKYKPQTWPATAYNYLKHAQAPKLSKTGSGTQPPRSAPFPLPT